MGIHSLRFKAKLTSLVLPLTHLRDLRVPHTVLRSPGRPLRMPMMGTTYTGLGPTGLETFCSLWAMFRTRIQARSPSSILCPTAHLPGHCGLDNAAMDANTQRPCQSVRSIH